MIKHTSFTPDELKGEHFSNQHFFKCSFSDTCLKLSSFEHCVFEACDFTGVIFEMTGFDHCSFPESKLSNLNFSESFFDHCDFSRAIVRDSIFQTFKAGTKNIRKKYDLHECIFKDVDLTNSIFVFCNLSGVEFAGSILVQTVFEQCDLTASSFTQTQTDGFSFNQCVIRKTQLDIDGFIHFGGTHGFVLA